MAARDRADSSALVVTAAALVACGIAVLYSAGQTDVPTAAARLWERQLVFLGIGVVAAVVVSRISPRLLEWIAPAFYGTAMFLLVLTLIVGTGAGTAAGSKSWLAIGGTRIGQPSELAKLAVILLLARHLAARREPPATLWQLLPAAGIVGLAFLLVGLQPDLGSALVFVGILFAMLFWAGVSPWLLLLFASPMLSLLTAFSTLSWGLWILLLTLVLLRLRPYLLEGLTVWLANVAMGIVALTLWNRLAPYQQNRLLSFLNMLYSDDHGRSWKVGRDVADHTSECQVVERPDGSLVVNCRTTSDELVARTTAVSRDRRVTWSEVTHDPLLPERGSQGSFLRPTRHFRTVAGETWLYSHPRTSRRSDVSVWLTDDGGRSWPAVRTVFHGLSAYSALAQLPDGSIGVLVECGSRGAFEQIAFGRFTLDWLRAGRPAEDPPTSQEP